MINGWDTYRVKSDHHHFVRAVRYTEAAGLDFSGEIFSEGDWNMKVETSEGSKGWPVYFAPEGSFIVQMSGGINYFFSEALFTLLYERVEQ